LEEKVSKLAGKGCEIIIPDEDRKPLLEIERSIIKGIENVYGAGL